MDGNKIRCPLCCNEVFSSCQSLQDHISTIFWQHISCPVCGDPVLGIQELLTHLGMHLSVEQNDVYVSKSIENVISLEGDIVSSITSDSIEQSMCSPFKLIDSTKVLSSASNNSSNKVNKIDSSSKEKLICSSVNSFERSEQLLENQVGDSLLVNVKHFQEISESKYYCSICEEKLFSFSDMQVHAMISHGIKLVLVNANCSLEFSDILAGDRKCLGKTVTTLQSNPYSKSDDLSFIKNHSEIQSDHLEKYLVMHQSTDSSEGVLPDSVSMLDGDSGLNFVNTDKSDHLIAPLLITNTVTSNEELVKPPLRSADSRHKCDVCDKLFSSEKNLCTHKERTHLKMKTSLCPICGLSFYNIHGLNAHLKFHKEKKPFSCEVCSKSFVWKSDLRRHQGVHTGKASHICEICGKGYLNGYLLNVHIRTHTGERPFTCHTCNASFKSKSNLRSHRNSVHSVRENKDTYSCDSCSKNFSTKLKLYHHSRLHSKPFKCTDCQRGFTCTRDLEQHMMTHTKNYNCDLCGLQFTQAVKLLKHMSAHKKNYV